MKEIITLEMKSNETKETINWENFEKLLKTIENHLKIEKSFDYLGIGQKLLEKLKEITLSLFDYFNKEEINKIVIERNYGFGEEWSKSIDLSFESGANFGNSIAIPIAYEFKPFLIDFWDKELASKPGRIFRDYMFRTYLAIPHEFVHCLQSKTKQLDKSPQNWIAEHDACYLGVAFLNWMHKNLPVETKNQLFPIDGFFEELILYSLDLAVGLFNNFGNNNTDFLYKNWRDSFGFDYPNDDDPNVVEGVPFYFKSRLGIEAFFDETNLFQTQINICFKNRTGVLQEQKMNIPKEILIDSSKSDLPILISSLKEEELKDFYKQIKNEI
ncbi:hypothetical protein M0811_08166 [Anaeramoeba ignava]|uniref:Uncharacterized protein n=1 Tax=Anaeramoeba ignava TaxID=1746090 RepID=A0A9Q0LJE7_ANAIG|nr:hypothetical protein M0811_08166 [Anaeramoeba ignava]